MSATIEYRTSGMVRLYDAQGLMFETKAIGMLLRFLRNRAIVIIGVR